uniref:Uncharacterized protein n=1 Tax=Odontella aurita TaxID=265563 RepID=A0A7S4JTB5_9STRA|mmetsp:Transcript_53685/g.160732  ORF Transcript_53685/g.160732 Transcript_53685/m.160732 type:complete len:192 (+) Transcript_53685:640-1215(+)
MWCWIHLPFRCLLKDHFGLFHLNSNKVVLVCHPLPDCAPERRAMDPLCLRNGVLWQSANPKENFSCQLPNHLTPADTAGTEELSKLRSFMFTEGRPFPIHSSTPLQMPEPTGNQGMRPPCWPCLSLRIFSQEQARFFMVAFTICRKKMRPHDGTYFVITTLAKSRFCLSNCLLDGNMGVDGDALQNEQYPK